MNQQPRKWHDLLDGWTGWLIILLTDRQSKRVYGDSLIGVHYWLTKQANLSDQWLAVIWFPAAVSSPVLLSSHLTRAVIFFCFWSIRLTSHPPPPPPQSLHYFLEMGFFLWLLLSSWEMVGCVGGNEMLSYGRKEEATEWILWSLRVIIAVTFLSEIFVSDV